ncbi:hypothetical protein B0H10DRAFT_1977259 [Mycena sp. CBHHK59/15]|nr:hypothetical protein B0H10DRAFT_1977259 [Mycena sp. CBHHK59/15]
MSLPMMSDAGHSVQVPELSGEQHTEIDGLDEVMVPSDGRIGSNSKTVDSILTRETCLVDNELKRLLINPLPDGATFLAVLDACHSASLLDLDHDECNGDWICFPERPDAPGKWGQLLSFHNTHMPRTAPAKEATTNQRNTRPSVARRAEIVDNVRQHGACARIKNTKMPGTFPRCDSPLGDPSKTLVISLSACRDDQDACESKDGSFTQHLISILKKDPHHRPRLRDLMEQLSIAVHGMLLNSMNLQQLNKLGGCQDPQISSNGTVSLEAYLETL